MREGQQHSVLWLLDDGLPVLRTEHSSCGWSVCPAGMALSGQPAEPNRGLEQQMCVISVLGLETGSR